MNINISFNTDNAAFQLDDEFDGEFDGKPNIDEEELNEVLDDCKKLITIMYYEGGGKRKIFDSNGNSVGTVEVTD